MSMPQKRYKGFPYPTTDCSKDELLTVQADKDEVDINKIVARIEKGHQVLAADGEPFYGDVSDFTGLQDALIKVREADDLFMQFPATVRERFDNDPTKFVEFMSDDKNTAEAISLGLATKKPEVIQASEAPAPAKPA